MMVGGRTGRPHHNGEGYVVRGSFRAVIAIATLALTAGTILTTEVASQAGVGRLAAGTPATSSEASSTTTTGTPTTTTTTTVVPAATTPPPPPPPPPITTVRPKPTTTKPTPKPQPAAGTPCIATARACIDLSANRSWLLDGAGHVTYGPVPITSGRPGYRTPVGVFRVQWKDIDHLSSEFDNAPMPYSVFFVGGIAFHAGSLTQQSHGCIHLSTGAAQTYYNRLRVGDIVQVVP